jgi:magnesium-transporting ATPase (P-type)
LTSSEQNGVAYVNTMNLDGETNLKLKRSNPRTYEALEHCLSKKNVKAKEDEMRSDYGGGVIDDEESIAYLLPKWQGNIVCQKPSKQLTDVRNYINLFFFIYILCFSLLDA